MKLVSIIIRTKNEERWIESCLKAVYSQQYRNIEVIVVDNMSTDYTVKKIEHFPVKIIKIKEFKPGLAINLGIRESKGDVIVCLSGHCIPTNDMWLSKLIENLDEVNVGGVYGRQEPLSFTSDIDKRDLLTVFRNERIVQRKDSFFHNANSAFRRETWEKFQFDEDVTNIEDRLWGVEIINGGKSIVYEPDASVYHWHGINHGSHPSRAQKIAGILENLGQINQNAHRNKIFESKVTAIVPIRAKELDLLGLELLKITIESLKSSSRVNNIIITTDDLAINDKIRPLCVDSVVYRPKELSEDYISIEQVLQYTLGQIEDIYGVQDIIVYADETYPFRAPELVGKMLEIMIDGGYDSVVAVIQEKRTIISKKNNEYCIIDDGFMPTKMKNIEHYVGLTGLLTVTRPNILRNGKLIGDNIGVYSVENKIQAVQVHAHDSVIDYSKILKQILIKKER